jgi:hypothetical protein
MLQYISNPDFAGKWKAACIGGLASGLQNAEGTGDTAKEKLKAVEAETENNASAALQSLKLLYD